MHRQHVLLREQEVLHGEHGLLHLARIAHAGDQHLACREIDDDGTVGIGAVTLGLANELGRVDDLPGRLGLGIVFGRIDEQATAEQVVPGRLGTHDDGQVVLDISTYMNVGDELITLVQVGAYALPQRRELLLRERPVDRPPVNGSARGGFLDNKAINRRTPRAMPRLDDQRAIGGQLSFATSQGLFH